MASYTLRVTCGMSRNDMVLLACGSRSISSVRLPRIARAAARLIAVVVFPTPPFWLAIATITGVACDCNRRNRFGDHDRHEKRRRQPKNFSAARTASSRCRSLAHDRDEVLYILYLPKSSGSRLSSHLCRRSASGLSAAASNGLALLMTASSTKIGARV